MAGRHRLLFSVKCCSISFPSLITVYCSRHTWGIMWHRVWKVWQRTAGGNSTMAGCNDWCFLRFAWEDYIRIDCMEVSLSCLIQYSTEITIEIIDSVCLCAIQPTTFHQQLWRLHWFVSKCAERMICFHSQSQISLQYHWFHFCR